ncbi:MAG: tryptophan synthase subunit alpha [Planctomycetota bacterium]
MNRIDTTFQRLRREGRAAFIAYLCAGDPDSGTIEALVAALAGVGADIIELGIPFSDPIADGPVIQRASARALRGGFSPDDALALVRRIRRRGIETPLVFMTYFNPVHAVGVRRFIRNMAAAGADGIIVPDLPPEEGRELAREGRAAGVKTIFLLAPTTTPARTRAVLGISTGFLYYVSVTGITGARKTLPVALASAVRAVRRRTKTPVCVGFGISRPQQVRAVARFADGVIVGSALVAAAEQNVKRGRKTVVAAVTRLARRLRAALE